MLTKEYIKELKNNGNGAIGELVNNNKNNVGSLVFILESLGQISEVLKRFEIEYKRLLISLLKEYYRLKYNPNLVFEENILSGLGFRQCKVCGE